MGQPQPLTRAEREKIYEGKLQGKTQAEIVKELDRPIYTVHILIGNEKGANLLRKLIGQ